MEVVCACLAADLGLPVPQPFLVDMHPEWIATLTDNEWADRARRSSSVAFGSRRLPPAFGQWLAKTSLTGDLPATAAAVLLFDALIDNPDRRAVNPNCLLRGDEIRIIDHELALSPVPLIGWRPPWELGALQGLATPGAHIFRDALYKRAIDWAPIGGRWRALSDGMIDDYEASLPPEWADSASAVRAGLLKVRNARDNIDGCIAEVQRLLT